MSEQRIEVLKRVPPGDRWTPTFTQEVIVFESLTEGLEYVFQEKGYREFHLAPLAGFVYAVVEVEDIPTPPKKYNLYGDY
jgi:hypothetical protein